MPLHVRLPDIDHWKQQIKCQTACPVSTDAGRYAQLIAESRIEDGFLVARAPNPFASVCGRVCAAPCEDACRRGAIDAPVSIRALKRFLTERYGVESVHPDTQSRLLDGAPVEGNTYPAHRLAKSAAPRGQRVAIIGAGPAGLAAAHDLALLGYDVTVFESAEEPGGMIRFAIPEYRLPRAVLHAEIERILALGVQLVTGVRLTPERGLAALRSAGFSAIFLAVGVAAGRDLLVPGSDLPGVVKALDFLQKVNRGKPVTVGSRVVVIGGGFVAFDAARTALRAGREAREAIDGASASDVATALDSARSAMRGGAAEVTIVSLETPDEMPVLKTAQGHEEYEEAKREGIKFVTRRGPLSFSGRDRLEAVTLKRVLSVFDAQGRFSPQYDDSDTITIPADNCILAIGQRADLSFIAPSDRIELTRAGTVAVDPKTLATSAQGVFAGGDVAFGPRNLIEAIANGKLAARSIHTYLGGGRATTTVNLEIEELPVRRYRMAAGFDLLDREPPPTIEVERRTGTCEVETGYDAEHARAQSARCLVCHVQTIYDSNECVLCNRCVDVCPEYCLAIVPFDSLDIDEATREMLRARASSADGPLSAMVKDDERCIRCGLCAERCPTGAMSMARFHITEEFRATEGRA